MKHGSGVRRALFAVGFVVAATALLVRLDVRAGTGLPVGGHDFVAYWSAGEVAAEGGDPYDEPTLQRVQEEIHPRYEHGPQRYWNPPWALVLLAPVLGFSFEVSTALWLVLSLLAGVGCVVVSWRLFVEDSWAIPPVALAVALAFHPFIEALALGQMSVLVTLAVLAGMLALREGRDAAAGALLALAVVKPQVGLLVGVVIAVHLIAAQRWRVLTSGALTAAALVLASRALHPSVWAGWDPAGGSPTHWHSATITGWLRATLQPDGGDPPTWPLVVVPAAAVLVTGLWALRHRDLIRWPAIPVLLVLSVLVAPYAWLADSTLIWPVSVVVLGAVVHGRPGARWRLGALEAVQVIALVALSLEGSAQHHQIVLPALMLLLAWSLPAGWVRGEAAHAPASADAVLAVR